MEAAALIRPLIQELSYATGVALERKKKKKNKQKNQLPHELILLGFFFPQLILWTIVDY